MKNENKLDQLFRKGLEDPAVPLNELDWQKMAGKLDKGQSKKLLSNWLYLAVGTAAALLVVLFWFLSDEHTAIQNKVNPKIYARSGPSAGKSKETSRTDDALSRHKNQQQDAFQARISYIKEDGIRDSSESSMKRVRNNYPIRNVLSARKDLRQLPLATLSKITEMIFMPSNTTNSIKKILEPVNDTVAGKIFSHPGKLTLSILAAPDVSNTASSVRSAISSNFGVLATYPISAKLSITSGAIYARKLYDYGGIAPSAYGNNGSPWEVDADCFVIDIPFNLNYKVFSKKRFSVTVNSGFSSYFMLKEKYKYIDAESDGSSKVTMLEINNRYQHLFGIANFSATFEHTVSKNLSIGVQPFYKVPLTGIGYHDSSLKSKGIAFSLSLRPFRSGN